MKAKREPISFQAPIYTDEIDEKFEDMEARHHQIFKELADLCHKIYKKLDKQRYQDHKTIQEFYLHIIAEMNDKNKQNLGITNIIEDKWQSLSLKEKY